MFPFFHRYQIYSGTETKNAFFLLSPSEIDPRPFKEPRPVEAEAELLLGIWSHLEVQLWRPNYSRHDFGPSDGLSAVARH